MKIGLTEKIVFSSESLELEGLLTHGKLPKAVVISHPHPVYGGDMNNQVVGLIAGAFKELGWTSLRFNFRGAGRSQGHFDDGVGEKEDVAAAFAYLKGLGFEQIYLAGYSFGAWINAQVASVKSDIMGTIMVSPPLAHFAFPKDNSKILLIVTGDQDPFCPLPEVKKLMNTLTPATALKVILEADHFYTSGSQEIAAAILEVFGKAQ